ncbi:hypothetical protein HKCCE2091_19545 [Rhodobacterales bacterium HKCCE2091]|nr:hypothetical protein [Rhodobacterales bacterium HKCCE2091]
MTRTEIEELLPFLANDTLDGPERAEVEAAVASDAALAAELAALKAIRTRMQAEEAEASPGELGLARLMRDIDRESAETGPVAATPPANVVPISRLRIWQVAAAVVLALALGQALLVPGADQTQGGDFGLASGDGPDAAFRVIFAPGVTEAEMRGIILDAGLEIVGGPSALGFYDLAPLDGEAGMDAARTALDAAGPLIETIEETQD